MGFTVEMHHSRVDFANPGDNVGLNIKGLDKNNMPRSGDVMVYKKDTTLGQTKEFNAQIQALDIPNEIKVGYSPIGFVRCGRSACRISKLIWKMGKETGGKKMEEPHSLKPNDGRMQLHPPAAVGLRYVQELRRHESCRFHGRQWRGDARARQCLRAQGGDWRWRQEEVIDSAV